MTKLNEKTRKTMEVALDTIERNNIHVSTLILSDKRAGKEQSKYLMSLYTLNKIAMEKLNAILNPADDEDCEFEECEYSDYVQDNEPIKA